MANEAVCRIETDLPINFTCSTTATIEKGAICKLTSPMTAVLADGDADNVAGIVQSEKLAAETSQNSVAIYRGGIFAVKCCGSISAGAPVTTNASTGGSNTVITAAADAEHILGIMLEDATEGQTKLMELRPASIELA